MNEIITIEMYVREDGKVPVKEFVNSLPTKLKAKATRDIDLLGKHGNTLGEPYVKSLKGKENKGLYELRVKFSNDNARIFYFTVKNQKYILLHGFIKKSMKTPKRELERARNYMQDYVRRSDNE